jgi:hypothetical protein
MNTDKKSRLSEELFIMKVMKDLDVFYMKAMKDFDALIDKYMVELEDSDIDAELFFRAVRANLKLLITGRPL